MDNLFGPDFKSFIQALNESNVDYLLVGGYAVILQGYHRTTGDLDIWVRCDESNYLNLVRAFGEFGLPTEAIPKKVFLDNDQVDVFRFGRPPVAIDIITRLKGVDFDNAFQNSLWFETKDLRVRLISYENLIKSKRAAGRIKDLLDLEKLEEQE